MATALLGPLTKFAMSNGKQLAAKATSLVKEQGDELSKKATSLIEEKGKELSEKATSIVEDTGKALVDGKMDEISKNIESSPEKDIGSKVSVTTTPSVQPAPVSPTVSVEPSTVPENAINNMISTLIPKSTPHADIDKVSIALADQISKPLIDALCENLKNNFEPIARHLSEGLKQEIIEKHTEEILMAILKFMKDTNDENNPLVTEAKKIQIKLDKIISDEKEAAKNAVLQPTPTSSSIVETPTIAGIMKPSAQPILPQAVSPMQQPVVAPSTVSTVKESIASLPELPEISSVEPISSEQVLESPELKPETLETVSETPESKPETMEIVEPVSETQESKPETVEPVSETHILQKEEGKEEEKKEGKEEKKEQLPVDQIPPPETTIKTGGGYKNKSKRMRKHIKSTIKKRNQNKNRRRTKKLSNRSRRLRFYSNK